MLATPDLLFINPFDPALPQSIRFSYPDKQIKGKKLIITDQKDMSLAYTGEELGMKLSYELPKEALAPGDYLARLQVFDFDDNYSDWSTAVSFCCRTAPFLEFVGFTKEGTNTIHNGNVTLTINFSQEENDILTEFTYFLYDYSKTLISKSESFHGEQNIQHTFYGLKNNSTYYVRCVGRTSANMSADTGYVALNVEYVTQPNNMLLNVINHKNEGYISVHCNILDIGYSLDNENYQAANGELTLTGNRLTYSSGFCFSDEFSIFVKARKLPIGEDFFRAATEEGDIVLSIVETGGDYYCELTASSVIDTYYHYAELPKTHLIDKSQNLILSTEGNALMATDTTYQDEYTMVFEVKRKNNLYSLKVYYENNGIIIT